MGDGTAFINSETERLLSSYVSLYLQISFDIRDKISALRQEHPFTKEKKNAVDSLALMATKYLELGIQQFPREWRCYWASAFVFEAAGMKPEAMNVLSKGLVAVPDYEEGGKARLAMSLQQISDMSDEPLQVEEPLPEADSSKDGHDSAKESKDSTPTVAMAE